MSENTAEQPRTMDEIQWEPQEPATIEDATVTRAILIIIARQLGHDGNNVAEIHLTPATATIRTITREDGEWKFREHTRHVI